MVRREALVVTRFIIDVLVNQLSIPLKQIVNDTTFAQYTGSRRPDLLISEFEHNIDQRDDARFIKNLVAYAEVKDGAVIGDQDWLDAIDQGKEKAPKLNLPYFAVTNCKSTIFYNAMTCKKIKLNNNPIQEFQTIDILRLIKNKLKQNPDHDNILTNVDSLAVISEAVFNRKLWELQKVYRNINFENKAQIIDFTIGFISLEYFEEKELIQGTRDESNIYWSNCIDDDDQSDEKMVANLSQYIERLKQESQFGEFDNFMEKVRLLIVGQGTDKALIDKHDVKQIYRIIDSMKPLHGCGFDLFGAIYEMFASSKEKKDFGEYFTRRHYAYILAKLLLLNEQYFNKTRKFRILDLACGTGGFLTESFKILQQQYARVDSLTDEARRFLEKECFWGIDVRRENISRTKLNMFLVGDGHTNMFSDNTLCRDFSSDGKWDYIITNPPYGAGTIRAETSVVSSRRNEIAFLYKIINLLRDGGRACIIQPDGTLENPSFADVRRELLEKCDVDAIISLPKFAFAPYTKEKTYAIYVTKKNRQAVRIQKKPIWMYIIDNDGLANSDKRFPTKLRNNRNGWLHDEISGWVNTDGEEMFGLLEERWMDFDDADSGTEWINEKGENVKMRKGGRIAMERIAKPDTYYSLLPEFYLRTQEPKYITLEELDRKMQDIRDQISGLL